MNKNVVNYKYTPGSNLNFLSLGRVAELIFEFRRHTTPQWIYSGLVLYAH